MKDNTFRENNRGQLIVEFSYIVCFQIRCDFVLGIVLSV